MTTATPEKTDGLKALQDAIDVIEEKIVDLGGVFRVEKPPKVVTASDEAELAKQMERAEAENAEVAGDDEDEEDEDGDGEGDDDAQEEDAAAESQEED